MKGFAILCSVALAAALGGCSSLSGLGGSDRLACPLTEGVTCKSMSQVYADTVLHEGTGRKTGAKQAVYGPTDADRLVDQPPLPVDGMPLRSRPRIRQIWVAPWQDADGDLHEGGFVDVRLDDGHWQIGHVRDRVRKAFGSFLKPPVKTATDDSHRPDSAPAATSADGTLPRNLLSALSAKQPPAKGGTPPFVPAD